MPERDKDRFEALLALPLFKVLFKATVPELWTVRVLPRLLLRLRPDSPNGLITDTVRGILLCIIEREMLVLSFTSGIIKRDALLLRLFELIWLTEV